MNGTACQSGSVSLRAKLRVPTLMIMIMATQALAEYVALGATRAATAMGYAFRNAVDVASDHFLVVVGIMIAIVFIFTFSLSKPR